MTRAISVVFLLCASVACCVLGADLSRDCSNVACLAVYCEGQYTVPGECCPRCPPDCSLVDCPNNDIYCPRPIYLSGRCCPICLSIAKDPCRDIACLQVYCEGQYTPPGACCPVCPPGGGESAI